LTAEPQRSWSSGFGRRERRSFRVLTLVNRVYGNKEQSQGFDPRDQAVERRLVKTRGEEVRIVIKGPQSHVWELRSDQVTQDSFDGDLVPW
jgi:hypothetical protein